jgi:hypothetical protein
MIPEANGHTNLNLLLTWRDRPVWSEASLIPRDHYDFQTASCYIICPLCGFIWPNSVLKDMMLRVNKFLHAIRFVHMSKEDILQYY